MRVHRVFGAHAFAGLASDAQVDEQWPVPCVLLLAMNRLEQAEAAYRKALATNDSEPAALTGLARVQLARGQVDDALTSAKRAVEMAPDAASAHLALGDVLRSRGDKSAAQVHYGQAAQLQ